MRRSRVVVVVLAVLALVVPGLSTASAAPQAPRAPEIGWVAPVAWTVPWKADTVQVLGSYRCWGGESIHLWVSVKQGGPDPTAEGSSSTVDAWYDTNVSQDVAVTCNGRWQAKLVTLGRHAEDYGGRDLGLLRNGKAWLQFCLVSGAEDDPNPMLASKNRWVHVVGAGRR